MNVVQRLGARLDALQRRHVSLAFPVAVIKKFGDDRAGRLAALIAYYGFFSMFPLLLALVTTLGLLMRGNPGLQRHILDSALSQFPIIGDQIKVTVEENTKLTIEGPSKEMVGRVAAEIRGYYPPEPYKGKGVRYVGEKVARKEGKTVQ